MLNHLLTIAIITYNSQRFIIPCLNNLYTDPQVEDVTLLVIDNHSRDKTPTCISTYPKTIQTIYNKRNLGYAAACNQAAALSKTPFVLFMNPDAFPQPGVINSLLRFMLEHPKTGAVSCRILNADKSIQFSCRNYPRPAYVGMRLLQRHNKHLHKRLHREYFLAELDHTITQPVPWLTAAFLMVRKEALQQVGGFDEGYFLYCEDVDLCLRLHRANWEITYIPEAGDTIHIHQQLSTHARLSAATIKHALIHTKSFIRFCRKHKNSLDHFHIPTSNA